MKTELRIISDDLNHGIVCITLSIRNEKFTIDGNNLQSRSNLTLG